MPKPLATSLACTIAFAAVLSHSPAYADAPSNDDFSNAAIVGATPYSDASSTFEATRAEDDPGCGDGGTIWYSYTATTDGYVEANTDGSNFDTMLGAYAGERGALSDLGCSDDSQYGVASAVVLQATAGTTYHFMVDNYYGAANGGDVVFNLLEVPPPPPALTIVVAEVTKGSVDRRGMVTVRGSVTCDQAGWADIWLSGERTNRRFTARGYGYASTACGTTPTTWSATFRSETGANFVAGRMRTNYEIYAYGEQAGGAYTSGSQVVRLTGTR